jgi:regulator of sigma E protease
LDIFSWIPSFGGFVWTMVAFVVALSIIVAVHEYGHYIVARWSGIDADVFSIGFGPVLMSRVDRRGTKWQVAALPFGGFVKFKGDANAASAKDGAAMAGLSKTELRRTMHGALGHGGCGTCVQFPAVDPAVCGLLLVAGHRNRRARCGRGQGHARI